MIAANNISKKITTGKNSITILNNVSFQIEQGTIAAIIGKSGCGKSTLLSIMGGIDRPSAGKVVLNGQDFYELGKKEQETFRNENIGMVFQNYHLIPELTCEENVRMPLVFSNKNISEEKIKNVMKMVGIEKKTKLFPKQMSGGEQQRTAIARALINQPSILYADEPTGALDAATGDKVMKFLIACAKELKLTILLVTHDTDIAKQCDKIINMADGTVNISNPKSL